MQPIHQNINQKDYHNAMLCHQDYLSKAVNIHFYDEIYSFLVPHTDMSGFRASRLNFFQWVKDLFLAGRRSSTHHEKIFDWPEKINLSLSKNQFEYFRMQKGFM